MLATLVGHDSPRSLFETVATLLDRLALMASRNGEVEPFGL